MRKAQLKSLVHFLLASIFSLAPLASLQPPTAVIAGANDPGQLKAASRQTLVVRGPDVSSPVTPGISPAVRDLPTAQPWQPGDPVRELTPRQNQVARPDGALPEAGFVDPLLQAAEANTGRTPAPLQNFAGIGSTGFVPPDTIGDVGPNHYVQMVNVSFAIFSKTGTLLTGPTAINALWTGQGNQCEANNDGDPVVLYDSLADRWLLAQFALPNPYYMCVAISQTPDPTGAYYLYEFQVPDFPDYPKFGVWPDAYYMSTNETNAAAYAFNRSAMLTGAAASFQRYTNSGNFMLPSDLDGPTPPPVGAPNYFYTLMDDTFWGGGPDRLQIWEFHVDWGTPLNSTFTLVTSLPTTAFTYTVCGFFVLNCITQPSPGETVDAVSEWPMWRFAYRNFGARQSLVGNFAIDVDNTNHSGIRWFELRNTGAGWSLYQEGTHAPDAHNRWMGSIAMDQDGNIALGYSVSSSSLMPAIRYATRLATDPLGTLQSEQTLVSGGGVQTNGANRWGDYSAMSVDPEDECTFWYTNEYYQTTSARSWSTRIGSFKIPSCGTLAETDLILTKTDAPDPVVVGEPLTYTLTIQNQGPISATNVILTDTLPASVLYASASITQGNCLESAGEVICTIGDLFYPGAITATVVVTPTAGGMIDNTAIVTSDNPDPTPGNNTAAASTQVNTYADLSLVKSATPEPVVAGELLTYTLTASNLGPHAASSVVVSDSLPAAAANVVSPGGCLPVAGAMHCTLSSLGASSSATFTITVRVGAGALGSFTNRASVTSASIDLDPSNNSQAITSTVQTRADLALSKSGAPDPVAAGEALTYTLTVQNNGPSNAAGVVLTDTLPAALTFGSASPGCNQVGSQVVCNLGVVAAASSEAVTITASVDPGYSGALANSAQVGSLTTDPNSVNNSASESVTVNPVADLELVKTAAPDPVKVSGLLTYTLVISNHGPAAAAGILLTDTLPADVTFHHASAGCTHANGVVVCALGTLPSGGSANYEIVVQVGGLPGEELDNIAEVSAATGDPNPGNNTAQVITSIQWQLWLPYLSQ